MVRGGAFGGGRQVGQVVCGLLEADNFDLVVTTEKWRHDKQRCFALGMSTHRKGLWQNSYGGDGSIYSTTTKKVKVIMTKCKKVLYGWKLKHACECD